MIEVKQSATLIQATPDAAMLIEKIARVCYNSEEKMGCECGRCPRCLERNKTFLSSLIKRGHESVFEHAWATFFIVTDRGISHELVRHRMASYTQESTRYVKYDNIPVILPAVNMNIVRDMIEDNIKESTRAYKVLVSNGQPYQTARDLLPICTATKLYMTANFREWRHVLKLRTGEGAHPKMRALAYEILDLIHPLLPVYFQDLKKGECQ